MHKIAAAAILAMLILSAPPHVRAQAPDPIVIDGPVSVDEILRGYIEGSLDKCFEEWPWDDWEMHRYRYSEEMGLAEKLIWDLLGMPLHHDRNQIKLDLGIAEEAFRELAGAVVDKVAENERRLERNGEIPSLTPLGRRPLR